ncbi:uncharacterized protein LOC135342770 [Halichondria panicea]|uniref:uncharacterized protein LOC135342770 n=1 Tax=Halichondria panicea TaxID=6063 RepID=UPI00312B49E3
MTFGEVGCFLSHHTIWQQMMTEGLNQILILEDDVVFEPYFRHDLTRVLEEANRITPNWDLIYAFHGDGSSSLYWACDHGNLNMVKLLMKRGADVNIQDTDNQTPLHYAVSCDHHAVISYLLQVAKARTDIADCDGNLPQDVTENQAN